MKEERKEKEYHIMLAIPRRLCQLRKDYASIQFYLNTFPHAIFYQFSSTSPSSQKGVTEEHGMFWHINICKW